MVYVDPITEHTQSSVKPAARKYGTSWCHLYADTLEELHAFAKRLYLARSWFQDHPLLPHYDLTPSKREIAVRYGAKEQTREECSVRVRAAMREKSGLR